MISRFNSFRGVLFVGGGLLVLTSCATVIHGTTQEVSIHSTPLGAKVIVNGHELITPGKIVLKRDRSYKIRVQKEGYREATMVIKRRRSAVVWTNILWWPIGFPIDYLTGAWYDLIPSKIDMDLQSEKK